MSMPGERIGSAHFLICGDMNTAPHSLSQMLQISRKNGSLHTEELIHQAELSKHGDLALSGGFRADTLATATENHDPKHDPYGVCWSMAQGSATKQPLPAPPTPARLELEDLESRAEQTGMCDSDIKQEVFALHAKYGNILRGEDFADEETDAAAAAAATEHSQDASDPQKLPADKQMIYAIVNELLGLMTFNNLEAEELLRRALDDESCLTPSMRERVEQMFSPIFVNYPNGLKDRSVWEPRDTSEYIRQWHELASMRTRVTADAAATEHGEQLSKVKQDQIYKYYMEDLKKHLRPEQRGKASTYYKSCAESKMRRQAGSVFVTKAIWAIGLPRLPSFATEQRGKKLSKEDLKAVPEAIHNVLNWLDHLANARSRHQHTKEYQDAVRKSGRIHEESGLTATEQETRTATRKAKFDMRTARNLVTQWNDGTLTSRNWQHRQEKLLHAYWDGSLQRRLDELSSQGSADPMCRTPLLQSMAVVSSPMCKTPLLAIHEWCQELEED